MIETADRAFLRDQRGNGAGQQEQRIAQPQDHERTQEEPARQAFMPARQVKGFRLGRDVHHGWPMPFRPAMRTWLLRCKRILALRACYGHRPIHSVDVRDALASRTRLPRLKRDYTLLEV